MRGYGLKVILFAAILFLFSLALSLPIARRFEKSIDEESKAITLLISAIISRSPNSEEAFMEIKDIVARLNFPVVLTNEMGLPIAWASIDVPADKFSLKELYRPDLLKEDPDYLKLIRWMGDLAEKHDPYEILNNRGDVVGYIYYGYPRYTSYIRYLPFLILFISLVFSVLLVEAGRIIHSYEIEAVWANFAKGLAHQMGTPVSGLMGWLEILKGLDLDDEILSHMERDVKRLQSILQRFSKIGGNVKVERFDLSRNLRELLDELKSRFLKEVNIQVETEDGLIVKGDEELIRWAMENLIKNSYEALGPGGFIKVKLFRKNDNVVFQVIDNGKGIDVQMKKRIFRESFSTKEHGWGIGLLLVRKIVEEFHHGKVQLIKSEPFVETIFEITFKGA